MIIEQPEVKHILDDYDILFASGYLMPITIDLAHGDTISLDDKAILVHLSAKPSQSNPARQLPAEDITVFTPHIISIQHRSREVVEPSLEQKAELAKTWQELVGVPTSKTLQ